MSKENEVIQEILDYNKRNVTQEDLHLCFLALHNAMQQLTIRLTQLENKVDKYLDELDDSRDDFYNTEVVY